MHYILDYQLCTLGYISLGLHILRILGFDAITCPRTYKDIHNYNFLNRCPFLNFIYYYKTTNFARDRHVENCHATRVVARAFLVPGGHLAKRSEDIDF